MIPILSLGIRFEEEVVIARQTARALAAKLAFDTQQQTRLATAVSEIARNAFQYAGGGRVEFTLEGDTQPQVLLVRISDRGPGIPDLRRILEERYTSKTGMGLGIIGARRLMDRFEIQSEPGRGTAIWMRKLLPRHSQFFSAADVESFAAELVSGQPRNLLEELRQQNGELLRTLEELRERQEELAQLNRELEDTNRGVVALYAELDERADHLRRADEVKTRFLSNMTHEFRTPLNSIQALSHLLLDRVDGDLTPEQERQVHFIRKAADSLSELVNDLLDLAKLAAGKIVIRPAEFDVGNLFGALRGMLRPLLLNTSVSLVFDEPENLPALETDEAKVSQILRNFISNALKFTERGEVRVSARLASDGSSRIIFSVADTGIGIAPEDQATIFQEFSQIESPLQRKVKGTGLGLPLSKKLAELLGGSIAVQSAPGFGSTFSVTIPIVYAGPETLSDVIVPPEVQHNKVPVLVVEDDIETRLLYEKYFRGSAFQCVPARTLREAEVLLDRIRPAAVILDVLLPDGYAWELLVRLKGQTATAAIPVLVVSNVQERNKAVSLGADAFSNKPLDRRWLLHHLNALTGRDAACRILVIDDEEVSRYLMRQLLSCSTAEIVEATNGADGLRLARDEQPHAIVLDLLMPDIHGFQVLEQLGKDPRTSAIPVIVCTSRQLDDADRTRIEHAGARLLPKSAFSDGTASAAIRGICGDLGLHIWEDPERVTATEGVSL